MTRQATPRHPGEHLAIVARIIRQIALDKKMPVIRRQTIITHLSAVQRELEAEIGK
jgi:hypothetical protein